MTPIPGFLHGLFSMKVKTFSLYFEMLVFGCSYASQFENLVFNQPGEAIHVADLT